MPGRDYQTHGLSKKTILGVAALVIPSDMKSAEVTAMGGVAATFTNLTLQYDTGTGPYAGTLPVGVTIPGVLTITLTAGQAFVLFAKT